MNSRKKVGILTFSYSSNPGSVLQAYALQNTISSISGFDASIINYTKTRAGKPVFGKTVFFGPVKSWSISKIIKWIICIMAYPLRMRKYEKFFKKNYNHYSSDMYTREDLPDVEKKYDIFVVGSDQVWNFGSPQVDTTHFFDFVKDGSKKISYAASFGQVGVPEEKREIVKELISDFSAISVREPDGVNIVSELTGRQATWVLDPSLLLDKQQYHKLAKKPKQKGYVFLYLREDSPRLMEFSEKLAESQGLTVIKVLNHWLCKDGKPLIALGPNEWLGYMENADYIVTNSFHGICFSVIFERQLFVDRLKGAASSTNPRIEGMLKQFELTNRSIDSFESINSLEAIDYNLVNAIKSRRKEESLHFLKEALERSADS